MSKKLYTYFVVTCVLAGIAVNQVKAESNIVNNAGESMVAENAPLSNTPTTTSGSAKVSNSTKPHSNVSFPKRVLGVLVGAAVGTPVCAVRKSIWETKYGADGMVGESDNKFLRYAATTFWLPFGVVTGLMEAPAYATINSLAYSGEPFGKDSFSLGEMAGEEQK